ncbi:MAG TPA: hypothetical protein VFX21_08395, partial [Acidimicrobiia bacterium]|nr:hypothetical protein [Acidimicrobiia bacterium]
TLRERLVQRPPRGITPPARVADVLRRATRALEREPQVTRAMLCAMASNDEGALPFKQEVDDNLRAIIADAVDHPSQRVANLDDIVHVLGSVWFAELTYWSNGLTGPGAMADNLARAAELLLP